MDQRTCSYCSMMRLNRAIHWLAVLLIFGGAISVAIEGGAEAQDQNATIRGFAYYDYNKNNQRDPDEQGAPLTTLIFIPRNSTPQIVGLIRDLGSGQGDFQLRVAPGQYWLYAAQFQGTVALPYVVNALERTFIDAKPSSTYYVEFLVTFGRISWGLKEPPGEESLRLGHEVPDGRFFRITAGEALAINIGLGFSVTNAEGIPFWDTWQRFGLENIGYPVSQRFLWKGLLTQVFQKAVFQWRPEAGQVYFINTFDELHNAGYDPWLLAYRATPVQLDPAFDAGKSWEQIVQDRLALLEENAAIKARYFAAPDPLLLYGLPTSRVTDMGNHWAIRLQRAVMQQWKVDVPWARAGEVTVANGGDIAKELGLFPAEALVPQPPP